MKIEVFKIKIDTREELPAGIMGATAQIKKCKCQLRRTTQLSCSLVEEQEGLTPLILKTSC